MRNERLQWCGECNRDYSASRFRVDGINYGAGVTGWKCPKGHTVVLCDEGRHEWVPDMNPDVYASECRRCHAGKIGRADWPTRTA